MIKKFPTQPLGLLIGRRWVKAFGSLRQKEQFGVLKRPNYAYGLLRAADLAKYFGKKKTTVCEFGVAGGDGLLNMISLGRQISLETGIEFRIVGFDTGEGLPKIEGYKDHPELWSAGDFAMQDRKMLLSRIGNRAEMIFGDIRDTINHFITTLDETAPLGFIAIDVDIYSATINSLQCLLGRPELYNPAVSIYFDDVTFFFANKWCGELAAIEEFNNENKMRKIDNDRSFPGNRPSKYENWYQQMYSCHILDHEARNVQIRKGKLSIEEHYNFMKSQFVS